MFNKPDFFLSSTEGYGLENPRACYRIRKLDGREEDAYLLVKIEPVLIGQKYGLGDKDIDTIILATRHKGTSLFPITEYPLSVHVARLLCDISDKDALSEKDIELIGWGEIYERLYERLRTEPYINKK